MRLEIETVREERDLYRSLLLAEPQPLLAFLSAALASGERVRAMLRSPTRDTAAFRGKIEQLSTEVAGIGTAMQTLHLPTVAARAAECELALRELQARASISGNDLLPLMVLLEGMCSHVAFAADIVGVPPPEVERADKAVGRSRPQVEAALRQLAEQTARACGKNAMLVTIGLEEIPEDWASDLFDALSQLVRNAVEHGIETDAARAHIGKPPAGTIIAEFIVSGNGGFELRFQDDGQGLDAARIANVAVGNGLLAASDAVGIEPRRLASLLFQGGLSTAASPDRRGHGLQIVRDRVRRIGGQIQIASKFGQFTRYRIQFSPLAAGNASAAGGRA
jgi:signal transduction histidine kinase